MPGASASRPRAALSQTTNALLGLRELVLTGEIAAGERIAELSIVERLGVSRTPVRAALVRLEQEGLVEALPSGGYAVRVFSEADVADAIELRGTLEGLAVRLAAERGVSTTVVAEMRHCLAELDRVVARAARDLEHLASYVVANERFHALMLEAAGNAILQRFFQRAIALPFASPSAFVLAQAKIPESLDILRVAQFQHYDIVAAIEARAGARAEALAREHARLAHKNLELAWRNKRAIRVIPGLSLIRRPPWQAARGEKQVP
jgi:GntR family transcriptional regulator of vanillate catabolism